VSAAVARTRLPRAEREQQALAAARTRFAEHGYAAVTMDDVAADVGVTKPLLYTYFGNKDGLFLACLAPAAEALEATVLDAVRDADRPAVALQRGLHAFFDFVDRERDAWRMLFDETLPADGEIAGFVTAQRERLMAVVARSGTSEAEALSAALLGACEAMARWWLRHGTFPAATAADLLLQTLRHPETRST
jgi:AcrR family transcriptional regulator